MDDYYDDNVLCKQIELIPLVPLPPGNPVRHRQPIIDNKLAFIGPLLTQFTLSIYSLNGIQVLEAEGDSYTGFSINLESLVPGLYILQYTIPATGQVYTEKMIKPY